MNVSSLFRPLIEKETDFLQGKNYRVNENSMKLFIDHTDKNLRNLANLLNSQEDNFSEIKTTVNKIVKETQNHKENHREKIQELFKLTDEKFTKISDYFEELLISFEIESKKMHGNQFENTELKDMLNSSHNKIAFKFDKEIKALKEEHEDIIKNIKDNCFVQKKELVSIHKKEMDRLVEKSIDERNEFKKKIRELQRENNSNKIFIKPF